MEPIFFIIVAFLPAVIAPCFRSGRAGYNALRKPSWKPPSAIIAPVWIVLNVLIGISAWLVWFGHGSAAWPALTLWTVQLLLNSAWAPLFFGAGKLGASVVLVGALWTTVLCTVLVFAGLVSLAGALLVPYLLWLTLVFVLNVSIWRLNRV
ncbi:MAG: benzodiazapine receptor [Bradymonadia bacterium]|jgi:benzodiazapine receptor